MSLRPAHGSSLRRSLSDVPFASTTPEKKPLSWIPRMSSLPTLIPIIPRRRTRNTVFSVLIIASLVWLLAVLSPPDALRQYTSVHHPSGPSRNEKALEALAAPHVPVVNSPDWDYKDGNDATSGYKWYSEAQLRALAVCQALGNCHPNAHKVVIVAAVHCHMANFAGYNGGEGFWCLGMIDSMKRQGYTVLYAKDDWHYIYHLYRQIPDLVKVVIATPKDKWQQSLKYYKSEKRPDGIPAWKVFSFHYYPNNFNTIVGNKWTISAEPDHTKTSQYIGYSLELAKKVIPFEDRPHRVWVLGKYTWFFYKWHGHDIWPRDFYERATNDLRKRWPDFEFVAAMSEGRDKKEIEEQGEHTIPNGIRNLGKMGPEEFEKAMGNSRLMLGIGRPGLSPSPWKALAAAIPFLNPKFSIAGYPAFQHSTLAKYVAEPYTYVVEKYDYDNFVASIAKAMETPIKPWLPEWMSREALDKRVANLIETDWRSEAAEILEQRKQGNETQRSCNGAECAKLDVFEL